MGNLIKRLFGGGGRGGGDGDEHTAEVIDYKDFRILPAPFKEGGQYKTAGRIEKEFDGTLKSAQFIRADNHDSLESAISFSASKARQIIDEQGDTIFDREHI